jgi:site-specific DNA-methyltransferase (adenine-specific)
MQRKAAVLSDYLNKVVVGDCLDVLSNIEDNSVDVCFADPPFNLDKRYNGYDDRKSVDDYLAWCRQWMKELVRVTKPTGSIFVHNIPKWLTYFAGILNDIAYFRHWIAWDAMSAPLGKTLLPAHYGILMYTKQPDGFKFYEVRAPHKTCRVCGAYLKDYGGKKDQMHAFGGLVSDVWTDIHRIRHAVRRDEHPCQLPPHLLERIVLMSTDVGDVVLDPFLGTGTTAIAAKALQRNFVGIELDENYARVSENKLAGVVPTIFKGVPVSMYLHKIQTIRDVDAQKLFPPQLTSTQKKQIRYQNDHKHDGKVRKETSLAPRLLDKVERKRKKSADIGETIPAKSLLD